MDQIVAEFADLEKVGRSVKLIGSEQPLQFPGRIKPFIKTIR